MSNEFAGKRIVVGVSGSIAAFKVAGWVSALAKDEARASVIMTDSAQKFVAPLTFAALSGEAPYTSMFCEDLNHAMSHIELAQKADLFLIAPATAQTLARLALGMADDLLSAAVLATRAPVVICPAMNSKMYQHQATQLNITKLKGYGYQVVDPDSGMMACKDDGPGRLVEWQTIKEVLAKNLRVNDLAGLKILITAGPTREAIDPARFISNRSSGKMGYALARSAYRRGAEVTLISGPSALECPHGVKRINVVTAQEMYDAVMEKFDESVIIIKSAAVSDFRPVYSHKHKIKKDKAEKELQLTQNTDILFTLGEKNKGKSKFLIGFAAESENIVAEGKKKLINKNLDLIVINQINSNNTGFEVDTNKVTLLDKDFVQELPFTSKLHTANMIFDYISKKINTSVLQS